MFTSVLSSPSNILSHNFTVHITQQLYFSVVVNTQHISLVFKNRQQQTSSLFLRHRLIRKNLVEYLSQKLYCHLSLTLPYFQGKMVRYIIRNRPFHSLSFSMPSSLALFEPLLYPCPQWLPLHLFVLFHFLYSSTFQCITLSIFLLHF